MVVNFAQYATWLERMHVGQQLSEIFSGDKIEHIY